MPEKRQPKSYEVCLSLWCYHCDYFDKPDLCWSAYKRESEK